MNAPYLWLVVIIGLSYDIQSLTAFQCSRYCKENQNDFGYKPGFMYTYIYKGQIATQINATKANVEPVYFSSKIQIVPLSRCDYKMQIIDPTTNSNPYRNFKDELQTPLYFSFQNGRIDTVCATNSDTTKSLNVKKAVLSSFQNSAQRDTVIYETDISGNCETQYEVVGESPLTIKKVKNLEACGNRYEKHFSWDSKPFNNHKKSSPLLRSTQSCTQTYDENKILIATQCEEKHLFRPFSNGEQGVVTFLTQTLDHIESTKVKLNDEYPSGLIYGSLLYEHNKGVSSKTSTLLETKELLKALELKTKDGVDAEVPRLFSRTVYLIENAEKETLLKIFAGSSDRQKKFFLDAMSLVTTLDGIEVMKEIKANDGLSQDQFDSWLSSLVFMKKPTIEILNSLQDFVNENSPSQKAVLAISGLLYRFCKENEHCDDDLIITDIIKKIDRPLRYGCGTTNRNLQEKILIALKGVGNAGMTSSFQQLRNCYKDPNADMEIILASIAAHRKFNCGKNDNFDDLFDVFANYSQNPEIRIGAYLTVMQCASYEIFSKIKNVLLNEETNQVGSFVWTHLVNLQGTSSQWKQGLKHLIENDLLKTKFNTDPRKYSRNYEASTFFESIDAGVSVESNVIFTSDSYLPKSAMLNFTLDLFGETVNMFEIGARAEGFEDLVENMFGPDGYFPERSVKNLLGHERDEHKKIQEMGDGFNARNLKKDPYGSLYYKIFGNEFSYMQFKKLGVLNETITMRVVFDKFMEIFRENDVEYTKSFKFIDSSFKLPTMLGFPLELDVNGTATVGLTVKGNVDLENLWLRKLRIGGKVYPSAAVEIQGAMAIDFFSNKHGVRSISTLNSNTYLDGHVIIDGGKLVDVQINAPKKQMDVINIRSALFYIDGEKLTKIPDVTTNTENSKKCTGKVVEKFTGLELCHRLKYVNASLEQHSPYFPLTGSFKYAVGIKKVDTFNSYNFHWKLHAEEEHSHKIDLYVDTPKSQTNRKIHASLDINKRTKSADLKISSPLGSIDFLTKVTSDYNKYGLYLHTISNNKELVLMESLVEYAQENYKVHAKFKYKGKSLVSVSGNMTSNNDEIKSNFKINDVIDVRSTIKATPGNYEIFSEFFSGDVPDGTLSAQVKLSHDGILAKSEYLSTSDNREEKLLLHFNVNRTEKNDIYENLLDFNFTSTAYPHYNTVVSFNSQRGTLYFNARGFVTLFGTTWRSRQLFKLRQSQYLDLALISTISCLKKNIDYQLILSHNSSEIDFYIHGLVQLNKVQRIETLLKYETIQYNKLLKVLMYYPNQAWLIEGKLKKLNLEQFQFEIIGEREVSKGKITFLNVDGRYINSTKNQMQDFAIAAKIHFDDADDFWKSPWIVNSSIQYSKDVILSSSQLQIKNDTYFTPLTWDADSFTTSLEINDKVVLFINQKKKFDKTNVVLGLNLYQEFEFNINVQPYKHIDVTLYWDKDKDLNQKVSFMVDTVEKGCYTTYLEYPNQKVFSSFTLLPTQITLNVTWGIEMSQEIYLNVGSKVYDVGGLYYGELETPFEYFEKQEFVLKYLVLKQNVEIQTNVSWHAHKINFMVAGSRSPTYLTGFVELNTTLAEISKFGVSVSHAQSSNKNVTERVTHVSFIYNEHQISAKSTWESQDLNMAGLFEVTSASNTINPVSGAVKIINNETTNYYNSHLTWQDKNITAEYKFENSKSYLIIQTPFEGLESTKFEYALIKTPDELAVEIEVRVLKKLNCVSLKWTDDKNNSYVQFKVVSPMTGAYYMLFKHSTLYGYLHEELIIKQGEKNEILALQIHGFVISILDVDANLSTKILGHSFAMSISNNATPLKSYIKVVWDNDTLTSNLKLVATSEKIVQLTWNVDSTLFDDSLLLNYHNFGPRYQMLFKAPSGYKLENSLHLDPSYVYIKNALKFTTPTDTSGAMYEHSMEKTKFTNKILLHSNNDEFNYSLSLHIDKNIHFVDEMDLAVDTTWHAPVFLKYNLKRTNDDHEIFLEPTLHFKFDNKTKFELLSNLTYGISSKDVTIFINTTVTPPMAIKGNFDFGKTSLNAEVKSADFSAKASIIWDENYYVFVELLSNDTKFLLDAKNDFFEMVAYASKFEFLGHVLIKNSKLRSRVRDLMIPHKRYLKININHNKPINDFDLKANCNVANVDLKFNPSVGLSLEGNLNKHEFSAKFLISTLKKKTRALNISNKIAVIGYYKHDNKNLLNLYLSSNHSIILTKNSLSFVLTAEYNKLNGNLTIFGDKLANVYKSNAFFDIPEIYTLNSNFISNLTSLNFNADTKSPSGAFQADVEILNRDRNFQTNIAVTNDNKTYDCEISTKYASILFSESSIIFATPHDRYRGHVTIKTGANNVVNVKFEKPDWKNYFEILLDVHGGYNLTGSANFRLDIVDLIEANATIRCDLESELKKVVLTYVPDVPTNSALFFLEVDGKIINGKVDLPGRKNYIIFNGTSDVAVDELSLKYNVNYKHYNFMIDVYHVNRNYTQTKINAVTNVKGWERTLFENKIDQDKIRLFLTARRQFVSLVANKNAIFNDKEILVVEYNHEPLLVIFSGREQSYLITSTMHIKYRLAVHYMTNPHIYGFSILSNGENLISLILQNNTSSEINFKGKLVAPLIFPKYPNVTLQLISNPIKDFQVVLSNGNEKLFEINWQTNITNGELNFNFNFHSQNPLLQHFELRPYVNLNDFEVKSTLSLKQRDVVQRYDLWLRMGGEKKIVFVYPCAEYVRCRFNLLIDDSLDFHWSSPLENWKNITIKSQLKLRNNSLSGYVSLEKKFNKFDQEFRLDSNERGIEVLLNMWSVASEQHNFTFRGKYEFYKSFKLKTTHDDSQLSITVNSGDLFEFLISNNASMILMKMIFDGNQFNFTVTDGYDTTTITLRQRILNQSHVYKLSTVSKRSETPRNKTTRRHVNDLIIEFEAVKFIGSALLGQYIEGTLTASHEKGLTFSGELKGTNWGMYANGSFSPENGLLNVFDGDSLLSLNYELAPNVKIDLNLKSKCMHIFRISCTHMYDEINSGFLYEDKCNKIEFDMKYNKTKDGLNGCIRLPISRNESVSFSSEIKRSHGYLMNNKVSWPNNQSIEIYGSFKENAVEFNSVSPITQPFKTLLSYEVDEKIVELKALASYGPENIAITGHLTPKERLVLNLNSSFAGYTSGFVDAKFDQTNRTAYLGIGKENLIAEFEGDIKKSKRNVHEIYMKTKSGPGVGNVTIKLDETNMKFNADIQWKNEQFVLDLSLDPKDLLINLTSPFSNQINLQGTYLRNKNGYELQTHGWWDTINVRFNGNLEIAPELWKIKSELKMGDVLGKFDLESTNSEFELLCYYPRPSDAIHLNFVAAANSTSVSAKTPFELFKNVNIENSNGVDEINVQIYANVLREDLAAAFMVSKADNRIKGKIKILVPQIGKNISGETCIEFNQTEHVLSDIFRFASVNNFNLTMAALDNGDSKQFLIQYFDKHFRYSDDYNNITIFNDYILTRVFLNLPDIYIKNVSVVNDVVRKRFEFSSTYGKLDVKWNKNLNIYYTDTSYCDVNVTLSYSNEGFNIFFKESRSRENIRTVSVSFVNNEKKFEIIEEEANLKTNVSSTNFQIELFKNLKRVFIEFDGFLLDLEKSEFVTKFHLMNDRFLIEDYVEYDFRLTNASMKFKTKSIVDLDFSIVFNTHSDLPSNLLNKGIAVQINLRTSEQELFELSYGGNANGYDFSTNVINRHKIKFKIICEEPYLIDVALNGVEIHGETTLYQTKFYVKSFEENLLAASADFQKNSVGIIIDVPKFEIVRFLKFKTAWGGDIYVSLNDIEIKSESLGDVSIAADLVFAEDGLDITTHVRLPFLKTFEKFDAELHLHKNFNPWFYVHLPNGKTYSGRINYTNNNDEFKVLAESSASNKTFSVNVEIKRNVSMHFELLTPYEKHKHFVFKISNADDHFESKAKFNEDIYGLEIDYRSKLRVELMTPFKNHENYFINLRNEKKSAVCLIYYPGLDREVGYEFVYDEQLFKYKFSLPVSINGFKYHSFIFKFNSTSHKINILSEINDERASLDVVFSDQIDYLKIDLATLKNDSLKVLFDSNVTNLGSLIEFNNEELWKFDYDYNKTVANFSCNTFWKSARFYYRYFDRYEHTLSGELWNTYDSNHKYGGHVITKDKISIRLLLPNETVTIDESYQTNQTHENYFIRLSWNKIAFGLKLFLFNAKVDDFIRRKTLINLELPFTTVEFNQNLNVFIPNFESLQISSDVALKWDNETIRLGNNFTNKLLDSRLSTSALNHDVVLHIKFPKLNQTPFNFTLQLEYSPDVQKLIEIEIFYDKTYVNETMLAERKFVVRQPSSNLNYSFVTNIVKTEKFINLTIVLLYVDYALNTPERMEASLEIGHENFDISGLIKTNRNRLNILAKSTSNFDSKGLQTQLVVNEKEPLTINFDCKFASSPSFTLITGYGDRKYTFNSKLPSKREFVSKLTHNIYGEDTIDGLFTVKLNTSSLLWMQIKWRRDILEQFSKAVVMEYSDLNFVIEATGKQLIDAVDTNFAKNLFADCRLLQKNITTYVHEQKRIIGNNYDQFVHQTLTCPNDYLCQQLKEMKIIWNKHDIIKNLTQPLFNITEALYDHQLELLSRTYDTVQRVLDEIEKTKDIDVEKLKNDAKTILNKSLNDATNSMKQMEALIVRLMDGFEDYVKKLYGNLERLFEPFLNLLNDFVSYFENRLAYLQILILDNMDAVHYYVQNLEEIKELLKMCNAFVKWLSDLQILEVLQPLNDFVQGIINTFANDVKTISDDYKSHFATLNTAIFGNYEMDKLSPFNDFKEFANDVYYRATWVWNYYNVFNNIKAYVHKKSSNMVNFLLFLNSGVSDENVIDVLDYVYRPDLGVIEITQPLPVEWESFDKTPSFERHPFYKEIFDKVDSLTTSRFYVYVNVLKSYVFAKRAPTANNFGMIVGQSHYVTLNDKHFDFVGDCSYVLASDFVSFYIIINYGQEGGVISKRSLTLMSHRNKIDIDKFVSVNGTKINLPLTIDNFLITRTDESITIDDFKKLQIVCNLHFDYCTVKISPWLFGNIGGLLGTLDNEKSTDFTMSDGQITKSVEEFAHSWKIDTCDTLTSSNHTLQKMTSPFVNKLLDTLCGNVFLDSNSSLSSCFQIVDPVPYYNMCTKDVRVKTSPTLCSSAAAYKARCEDKYAFVNIPNSCVTCQSSASKTTKQNSCVGKIDCAKCTSPKGNKLNVYELWNIKL